MGRLFLVANAVAGDTLAFSNVERTEAADERGLLRGGHPLAGRTLVTNVTIRGYSEQRMVLRETDEAWEHTPEYEGFRPVPGMR